MLSIKYFKKLKYNESFGNYSSLNYEFEKNISFLSYFLISNFGYIKKNLEAHILKLNIVESMNWNDDTIIIDQQSNQVYLGIVPDFCCDEIYDDMDKDKMMEMSLLELYQANLLEHMIISKKNFIHILYQWNECLEKKFPFLLLYKNSHDIFNIKSFETQEEMNTFVLKH